MTRMLSGHPESFPITDGTAAASSKWLMTMAASGTAFSGPWGVSFAANLTPDENTGLGIWTEEMFVKVVRTGRHMGVSRPILPPMPCRRHERRRPEGGLRVSAIDSTGAQPCAGSASTAVRGRRSKPRRATSECLGSVA
jgi:hypothetical protein